MQAALLVQPGEVAITKVPRPQAGPSEVVVEVRSCGVCATDVKKFAGVSKTPKLPFILGHEPAGVIVEVGEGVGPELASGTRVAVAPVLTCGHCFGCSSGLAHSQGMGMCENYQVLGHSIDGAFAEYVVALASHVHPIPDTLSFRDAALIEPVAACANGALRAARVPPGTVVVIGAGFMGLVTIQLLAILGSRVISSDLQEERRRLALKLGADAAFDPGAEDVVESVKAATNGRGADGVVCAVGGKAVTEQGLAMLARGGNLVLLASGPGGTRFEVDLNKMHYDQSVITGSVSYTGMGYQWSMELLSRGILDVDTLITAVGSLQDTQRFLEMTRDLQGLKKVILIEPGESRVEPLRSSGE
jgi:threonine dehydrogenase-like Zn-dependent dehydrogenase